MDLAQIAKRISLLEKYSKEIRDAKEMLKEELLNDEAFVEAEKEATEANNKKKKIKDEIFAKGPNQKLLAEIKGNAEEITLLREILSAELVQVYKETDAEEILDQDGEARKFKLNVKLAPKKGVNHDRDNFGKFTPQQEEN